MGHRYTGIVGKIICVIELIPSGFRSGKYKQRENMKRCLHTQGKFREAEHVSIIPVIKGYKNSLSMYVFLRVLKTLLWFIFASEQPKRFFCCFFLAAATHPDKHKQQRSSMRGILMK